MHKFYGFDLFILDFDLDPEDDEFIIQKLKTPEVHQPIT